MILGQIEDDVGMQNQYNMLNSQIMVYFLKELFEEAENAGFTSIKNDFVNVVFIPKSYCADIL